MKRNLFCLVSVFSIVSSMAQVLSFGAGLMPRYNFLTGADDEQYIRNNRHMQFSAIDLTYDTLNFYFTNFRADNNLEVPFYFHYQGKKRWAVDLSYSSSRLSVQMEGKSNYSDNTLMMWYPKQPFIDSCYANGVADPEKEYDAYMDERYASWETDFSYKENVKIKNFSLTANYSFLPHKAFRPFLQGGFSIRHVVKNYSYRHFDMQNVWLRDQTPVSQGGIDKFPDLFCVKLGGGVETYRFRAGVSADMSFVGQTNPMQHDPAKIVNKKSTYPFGGFFSVGIFLNADLISRDLAEKKQSSSADNQVEVPKIKMKKDKWSLGLRYNNPLASSLQSYYSKAKPLNIFFFKNVYDFSSQSQYPGVTYYDMVTIQDVSLVDFRPQVEGFIRKIFFGKLAWESSLGFYVLKVDFQTRELLARITFDKQAPYETHYDIFNTTVRSGVYRNSYPIISIGQNFGFDLYSSDFLKLRAFAGVSVNFAGLHASVKSNKREGINSQESVQVFDRWYSVGGASANLSSYDSTHFGDALYMSEHQIEIDLEESPDSLLNSYGSDYSVIPGKDYDLGSEKRFQTKQSAKSSFFSCRFGAEAEVNRFLIGAFYETNLGYMDGVLLKKYNLFSLSVGYLFFKR
jgi:hypothetical protein